MPSKPHFQGIQQAETIDDDYGDESSSSMNINDGSQSSTTAPALVSSITENSENCTVANNDREQEVPEPIAVQQMPRVSYSVKSPKSEASFGLLGNRSQAVSLVLQQQNLQVSPKTTVVNNETVKVVPSTILSPRILTDVSSPASKGSMPTTTQSGTVQVIDLTRHSISDAHLSKNGIAAATATSQPRSLSLDTLSQVPPDVILNSMGNISSNNEMSREHTPTVVTRNNSSSTPTRGMCCMYVAVVFTKLISL